MSKETEKRLIRTLEYLREPHGSTIPTLVKAMNVEGPQLSLKRIVQTLRGCLENGILKVADGRVKLKQVSMHSELNNAKDSPLDQFGSRPKSGCGKPCPKPCSKPCPPSVGPKPCSKPCSKPCTKPIGKPCSKPCAKSCSKPCPNKDENVNGTGDANGNVVVESGDSNFEEAKSESCKPKARYAKTKPRCPRPKPKCAKKPRSSKKPRCHKKPKCPKSRTKSMKHKKYSHKKMCCKKRKSE